MKLLLDEMLSPAIARALRARQHDVVAVVERDDCRGKSDREILVLASDEGRAIVTENVPDFRKLVNELQRNGAFHAGIILFSATQFSRSNRNGVGRFVEAIEALGRDHEDVTNLELWLK